MWFYGILLVMSACAAVVAVSNIIISTDSLSYGLVSQQIQTGRGIRIPVIGNIYGFGTMTPSDGTVPFLIQPPLFPAMLALFGGLSLKSFLSAQLLNAASHIVTALFSFLLMRRLYSSTLIALFTSVLIAFSFPLMRITHHATSDALFTALTVISLYFFTAARTAGAKRYGPNLILAGFFAGAAITTRYAGLAIVVLFFWEALRLFSRKEPWARIRSVLYATIIPAATVATLFIRNHIHTGTIRGASGVPAPDRAFPEALSGSVKMLFSQFQLGERSAYLVSFLVTALVIFCLLNAEVRGRIRSLLAAGLDIILVFIAGYFFLIVIALVSDQPYFEMRYVTPLVPFLFITVILLAVSLRDTLSLNSSSRLPNFALSFFLVALLLGSFYKTALNIPEFFYRQEKVYSIMNNCAFHWLTENYDRSAVIATDTPYHLSFFGGYTTLILPSRKWVPNAEIPENMESVLPERMESAGSSLLVFFNRLSKKQFGSFVSGLSHKTDDSGPYQIEYVCSESTVYRLEKDSLP